MKHKRHQKDRRDKSEKVHRHEDHRYYKAEYCARSEYKQYTTKNLSENRGDSNEPKKLIIYIVIRIIFVILCDLFKSKLRKLPYSTDSVSFCSRC